MKCVTSNMGYPLVRPGESLHCLSPISTPLPFAAHGLLEPLYFSHSLLERIGIRNHRPVAHTCPTPAPPPRTPQGRAARCVCTQVQVVASVRRPKSTPALGLAVGTGSGLSISTCKDTYQCPACSLTVALNTFASWVGK